ncbi:MAG: hypothetical protein HPY50_18810 [Firmicutes bacterium]|nr:hypothetical protein [Bacillota bacterium]
MNLRFDFVIHWLWAIVFAVLAISGFALIGAKYGWIVNYSIAAADYVHRVGSAVFVLLTLLAIGNAAIKAWKNENRPSAWMIIGASGFRLCNFIISLILIITGAFIWICSEYNHVQVAFALYLHEYAAFLALAGVIWHLYQKSHALDWPAVKTKGKGGPADAAKTVV